MLNGLQQLFIGYLSKTMAKIVLCRGEERKKVGLAYSNGKPIGIDFLKGSDKDGFSVGVYYGDT